MPKIGDELKNFAGNLFTGSILAIMFMDFPLGLLFGFGAAVAGTARHIERYRDLLVRGLGFTIMSLSVFLFHSDVWFRLFVGSFLAWVALVYFVAYILYVRYKNDFLERNFIGIAFIGAVSSFILSYPSFSSAIMFIFYLMTSLAVLYLVYLVSSYVSSKRTDLGEVPPLPLPNLEPRKDAYSRDLERVIRAFVERGDSAPLLVFVVKNSPQGIYTPHLEDIIRPIANYKEARISSLAPPWVAEKMVLKEKKRRGLLVEELVRRLDAHGGIGKWKD